MMSRPSPPKCHLCSYRQPYPSQRPVFHLHNSAREFRILQRVEYEQENRLYLCPTCQATHPARPAYGLNICVSDSTLHNLHQPRDEGVVCPADTIHVDWVTVPGSKIADLSLAWSVDYHREARPMRILLVAGLNDLVKGGTRESVMESITNFRDMVARNNRYHPGAKNQFAVAPLLCPPKLVWYEDNGHIPPGHAGNRKEEVEKLNNDILSFNAQHGMLHVPHFNTMGVRRTKLWYEDSSWRNVTQHRWNQWRASEEVHDKLHLVDNMRVRMGRMVISHFEGEIGRENGAIAQY